MKLSGAQAIVKLLEEQGVKTLFGYPGGSVIPLYDALYDAKNLNNVLAAHEQGAIHAADGYARATGKTGVCIATSGPGATNIVTGIATAYLDSVPVVAITGQVQVKHLGRDSFQEIDIVGVTIPITKYNAIVRKPEDLLPMLRRAFKIAAEGRPGPVLIDIPGSIQTSEITWTEPEEDLKADPYSNECKEKNAQEKELLIAASVVLSNAERPVLLVGGGAILGAAEKEVREFAEKTGIPVIHTLMGHGAFPGSSTQCLGMTGMHGHIAANKAISNADVMVVAGSRLSERVTGDRDRYVGKKTIIQIDIDPSELDKNVVSSLPLVGCVKETLAKLNKKVGKLSIKPWWETIRAWENTEIEPLKTNKKLTAPWLLEELNQNFKGENPYYITDVGQNQMWAAQHLRIDEPRHFITSGGCGTMGFGLPGAIGAKQGLLDFGIKNPVVSISGDGGFKMTGMELYTAVRENLPLVSIVINNSCLGMVRQWQEVFHEERYSATLLTEFDFVGFARSCGADGIKVKTQKEFTAALNKAKKLGKPFLIEAVIEQADLVIPMVAPGTVIDDFVDPNKR